MIILLNGEEKKLQQETSIALLVEEMELGKKRYAVEVNEEIIPKSEHAEHMLLDGDRVEVVVAIGGG